MADDKKITMGRLATGLVFIALGIFLLIVRFTEFPFGRGIWPFFLIIGGSLFYLGYFWGRGRQSGNVGLLFPGTYLFILGLLFLFLNVFGWRYMQYLWPTFVLGVAIALGVMYFFSPSASTTQRKDLRSSALVMILISAGLFIIAAKAGIFWPIILIVIGLLVIFKGFKKDKTD